ncbi:hypothetical protein ANCDUO_05398 [Ancylostoma duodenale]|uniref:Uncharacterized protein n=1 Tax=Ancylostoma duodenale TaxID=51022 RepID=A0A0C2H4H4_9BILA|nr:hypothetical protein ANCDUO_05398 [Ancylostoma duodenale]
MRWRIPELLEKLDLRVRPAKKVSARNTTLSAQESSSMMAPVVERDFIDTSSYCAQESFLKKSHANCANSQTTAGDTVVISNN